MNKAFYLTTPLYYVNGVPHVGHAYTSVIADAIARYKRMCGLKVLCLTGTDEHGLKIERTARQEALTPQKLTDVYALAFEQAWDKLDLDFSEFIRTTQSRHRKAVVEVFKRIKNNGYIYLGEYSGYYCVNCEAYVPEGEKTCSDCGRLTEFMTEESYFFKLSSFQDQLLNFYKNHSDFIIPSTRMNEIISFVKGGLKDLSISRTSFSWGIPVPGDEKHIFYVWFDALIGYLSGIGFATQQEKFEQFWPADVQLIGKDILRFHAVYWPAFLIAAGLEPPRQLLVNGWWTVDGEKISKSRGNTVTADELMDLARPDYVKYFLLREISVGADGNFSYELLLTRINSDLANDLGNLAKRTLHMIDDYFGGKIPECAETEARDDEHRQFTSETVDLYQKNFDCLQINKAIDNVWGLISATNKYIVANEPWVIARDLEGRDRLGTILYHCAESLRVIATLLVPIVPEGAALILKQLGIVETAGSIGMANVSWGNLKHGSQISQLEAVYPRLDRNDFMKKVAQKREGQESHVTKDRVKDKEMVEVSKTIGIKDFVGVEMRVGKIIKADKIPKSGKLLKVEVDLGSEVRQVVAGIGEEYLPEELPGRLVAVVTNLKPAKLMGVESNGMILAASDEGRPVLVTFTEPVRLGARLK